jgi:hypothetical protein
VPSQPEEFEFEVNDHAFVPDGKTVFCARDTYTKEDHNPHPFGPNICGKRVYPYTANNYCVLDNHSAGNHRDARDREFDVSYTKTV